MERLTEKVFGFIQLKACGNDFCTETCAEQNEEKSCKNCPIQKAFEKLATYEDLEEQGLLLRLPCKVGDTVYCIEDKKIWDCIVDKVTISRTNGVWFEVKTPKSMPDISAIEYTENAFGETVFLTQAEAEQKLKENGE